MSAYQFIDQIVQSVTLAGVLAAIVFRIYRGYYVNSKKTKPVPGKLFDIMYQEIRVMIAVAYLYLLQSGMDFGGLIFYDKSWISFPIDLFISYLWFRMSKDTFKIMKEVFGDYNQK